MDPQISANALYFLGTERDPLKDNSIIVYVNLKHSLLIVLYSAVF